jgi:putative aldouronate transport system substrate-binding protein
MKKTLALLLAAASTATMLAGCGGTAASSTSGSAAASTAASTADTATAEATATGYDSIEKPASIVWWTHDGLKQEDGIDQWVAEFKKKTGIELELDPLDNNEYYNKMELAYASDTAPDTFDLDGEHLGVYASQGAIADLTDLVKESGLYDKVDKSLWDAVTLDGKIYGVPREKPGPCVTYVRKDWLDRLGMEVPTTYDEFVEMLTRFKNEIPECTVPYTAPGLKSAQNLPEFYQGAVADYTKIDGQWVDGMQQDNMLEALQRMQDAYAAGLIDTEAVTNTTSACRDEWYAGGVGAFCYWGGNWGSTLTTRVQQNVPEAVVVAIPPIEGAMYRTSAPSVQVISSKLSDDEIASVFKYFIGYSHDGGEGQVLFQSGVEGVHWEQQGNKLVPLPEISNPENPLYKCFITPWVSISPLELTDKAMDLDDALTASQAVADQYAVNTPVFPVSETRTMIASDLTTARENVIAKVVMGQESPADGMAEYKAQAQSLGIDQVLTEMNAG